MLCLAPILPEFRAQYPRLDIQIVTANRYPDFIEAGIDVAIRTREHEPNSSITVRKLGSTPRLLAAAPSYLSRKGVPRVPEDLKDHDMLVYTLANDPNLLHLMRGTRMETVRIAGALDSNDGQVIRQAALAGMGILIQPLYIIADDVRAGRLTPILTQWTLPTLNMNIAWSNRSRLPAKIRVFVDFLVARIGANRASGINAA